MMIYELKSHTVLSLGMERNKFKKLKNLNFKNELYHNVKLYHARFSFYFASSY